MLLPMVGIETKRLRGDALRERVLKTALDLFSANGYFNTSIHDIQREAGVSIGAIYHHFQSKEALAKSLYGSLLTRIEAALEPIVQRQSGCLMRSRAIFALLFALTMQEPRMMQFGLLAKHSEYLPDEPPICSSRPFVMMRSVLEDAMAAGEVRDMEPWVAATAMFGGALRMMNLQLDGALEHPLSDYLVEVVDCGWRAVKA